MTTNKLIGPWDALIQQYRLDEPVLVTRPTMPSLSRFQDQVEQIWDSRWLTNAGPYHQRLEAELAHWLGVEHLSLFCNGTIALLVALQALRINGGEVITTPFTFPATAHMLWWNRIQPVFCDIEPQTGNIDPDQVERLIGPETRAILPVHVYGNPCQLEALQTICDRHGLMLIYDAAHAFGVRYQGRPLASWGDLSMLSFHATKLFSTIEGGAIVASSAEQKQRIDLLKNFGIAGEESVIGPGINGKMNELQAAFGLLALEHMDEELAARRRLMQAYRRGLAGLPGVRLIDPSDTQLESNHAYMPILIDAAEYGINRDQLFDLLKQFNIHPRKYFFPLCSHFPCYSALPSAAPERLPVAERMAREVLCLPIFGTLAEHTVATICQVMHEIHAAAGMESQVSAR